jgi:Tfp pilus assembly protein PilN
MSTKTLPDSRPADVKGARPSGRELRAATVASPRVDLLPPEIGERNRQRAARRGMRMLIFFALIIVLVGVAGTWYLSTSAQLALLAESGKTNTLMTQQAQYADVRQAQNAIAVGEAAQRVGASTEIDWNDYLAKLAASLPEGVVITEVVIDAQSAEVPYPQSEVPLEGARIATLTFSAKSATLPIIPDWLERMRKLPGFVDALPGSVNRVTDGYTASIKMHINELAYSLRFAEEAPADGETADGEATGGETAETTGDQQ